MKVGTMIAVVVLAGIILMSVFAPLIAPYDPLEVNIKNSLQQPSAQHWLGTDAIGRDLLSRVIYGGRQSIILAVVATALSMLVGLIIGVIAGYFGGVVDMVITSFSSIFQGLPGTQHDDRRRRYGTRDPRHDRGNSDHILGGIFPDCQGRSDENQAGKIRGGTAGVRGRQSADCSPAYHAQFDQQLYYYFYYENCKSDPVGSLFKLPRTGTPAADAGLGGYDK